jgi:hypothetical protein
MTRGEGPDGERELPARFGRYRVFHLGVRRNASIIRTEAMESQVFSPSAYSFSPIDLIPDDDEPDEDVRWLEYCRCAATVDRQHVLECVLSDLDADDSPLYDVIDSALKTPHEPGRARESITILAQIGQVILDRVAAAVDDQVNIRMAVEGRS